MGAPGFAFAFALPARRVASPAGSGVAAKRRLRAYSRRLMDRGLYKRRKGPIGPFPPTGWRLLLLFVVAADAAFAARLARGRAALRFVVLLGAAARHLRLAGLAALAAAHVLAGSIRHFVLLSLGIAAAGPLPRDGASRLAACGRRGRVASSNACAWPAMHRPFRFKCPRL